MEYILYIIAFFPLLMLLLLIPDRELRALQNINKLANWFNDKMEKHQLDLIYLLEIRDKFLNIKTKQHTDKIDLYLFMINSILNIDKEKLLQTN